MRHNLIKRTFTTTDTRGCAFRATLYRTRVGVDPVTLQYRTDDVYVADLGNPPVVATSLQQLKERVGSLP